LADLASTRTEVLVVGNHIGAVTDMQSMTTAKKFTVLLARFRQDEMGTFAILTGIVLPVLVGAAGLGTEVGLWYYQHQKMQSAADSGAVSAALAPSNWTGQANAVTASYGYVNGVGGVTVTVNKPPKSGSHVGTPGAVEVIVQQPQPRLFSAIFSSAPVTVSARAVAVNDAEGKGCVLALNKTVGKAVDVQGNTDAELIGCSLYDNSGHSSAALNASGSSKLSALSVHVVGKISGQTVIQTTNGVYTGVAGAPDPYASVANPTPAGPTYNYPNPINSSTTLNPGVYPSGLKLGAQANVKLNPGTYFIEAGSNGKGGLDIAGGATFKGDGVTLVFTSGNGTDYATATINGGANVNLTAPTSGPLSGIAVFGDRNMPVGTSFKFNGGATQSVTGAIYLSKAAVSFAGGIDNPNACLQLIADTVTLIGNSYFAIDCNGKGTKPLKATLVTLVE
jgi:hypothetical protein